MIGGWMKMVRQIVQVKEIVNDHFRLSAHFSMTDEKTYIVNFFKVKDKYKYIFSSCLNIGQFGTDPQFTESEIQFLEQYANLYWQIFAHQSS
jgi:hypothetical protein